MLTRNTLWPYVCPSICHNVNVNVNVNSGSHNCKASNALCTLVEREEKSFQVTTKTVHRTRRITKIEVNEFQAAGPATEKA